MNSKALERKLRQHGSSAVVLSKLRSGMVEGPLSSGQKAALGFPKAPFRRIKRLLLSDQRITGTQPYRSTYCHNAQEYLTHC